MSDPKADTTDQSCAVICMLVSNPAGKLRTVGWQKRVNDLIRALRDERNAAADRVKALEAALRKAQEVLAELNTSIDNFWNDRRRPRLGNTCISSVNRVAVAQISSRAALAEIEKVLK